MGLAALTLLSEAANEDGLVCVVDDAQWLDQTSAEVLAFVARRCHADRIGFLFGVREPAERSVALEGLASVTVLGLDAAAAHRLLADLVSGALDRRVREQIVERAAGNPLGIGGTDQGADPGTARRRGLVAGSASAGCGHADQVLAASGSSTGAGSGSCCFWPRQSPRVTFSCSSARPSVWASSGPWRIPEGSAVCWT